MSKGSNYERYRQSAYNRVEEYPIRPLAHAENYRPVASYVGRLILPLPDQRMRGDGVFIQIQQADDSALIGRTFSLRWTDAPLVQEMVASVTRDVTFNWRTRKTRALGIGYPERINGWKAVGPLESLAAQHPCDDIIVALRGPVGRPTDDYGTETETLYINQQPLLVTGRFYGLVTFVGADTAIPDGYTVRHFRRETGRFDGPSEVVLMPETLPDKKNAAMSRRESILSSHLNGSGWYVYGTPNDAGEFVVQGIVPRALLCLLPQKTQLGKARTIAYIKEEAWRRIYQRKGEVLSVALAADGQSEAETIAAWKEGDQGLLLHVFGRYTPRAFLLGMRQATCLGHFAFGIATVIREPLSGELRFEITYEQVYTNNTEGVIAGANAYAHYMGNRQFGFLGNLPVVDILLKFDPVDKDYDFDGVKRSPLAEFARNLEIMTARYRIADGKGGTYVGPANNCSQDSNQTLYATVRYLPQTDDELEKRSDWAKRNPEEGARLARLTALAESLRQKLFPLGSARADWRDQTPDLGSSFEDNPLTSAWLAILTWRTVLPHVAADSIARIFLEHGASAWVLGTSLVSGDNENLEAVVPLHFQLRSGKSRLLERGTQKYKDPIDIAAEMKAIAERAAAETIEIAEITAKKYCALVVDDEPKIVRLMKVRLEQHGYTVETADNGKQALEKIKTSRPDVLITDVMMPEMTGTELIKAIRSDEALADLPILLLAAKSADARVDPNASFVQSGANSFITKPFNPKELVAIVSEMLRTHGKEPT